MATACLGAPAQPQPGGRPPDPGRVEERAAENVPVLGLSGLKAMQKGKAGEAEALFRRAVERRPNLRDLWRNLASALEDTGNRAGAETPYQKALGINADHLSAVLLRVDGNFDYATVMHACASQSPSVRVSGCHPATGRRS